MTRNAQDIIDDMRNIVKPRIAKMLLEANFEGCGKEDKAEFETEFEMILTLAEMGLKNTRDDAVSRQVIKEQMLKYGFHAPDMTVTEFVEDLPPALPKREHGEWLDKQITNDYHIIGICSLCHERNRIGQACRSCGALMR